MPELPEVETIKRILQSKIVELAIKNVEVRSARSFIGDPQKLYRKKITGTWRRAKILGVELSGNLTLLFHLKMSGQLIFEGEDRFIGGHPTSDMLGPMPNSHTRVIFSFSDGSKLYFNDQRKFGWVKVVATKDAPNDKALKNLGPEPLEKSFTWQVLKTNLLKHKSMAVKTAIMDQSAIAGVGNIYASEACFDARVNPATKVQDLTDEQFKKLHKAVIKALNEGIKRGGSTRAHFVDPEGHRGYFLDYAFVYGKDGHPCKVCGTTIKKIQINGRGTYLCPHCQK